MGNRRLSVSGWHGDFEDAELILRHWGGVTVPVVEVTDQVCAESIGRPFSVYNVAVVLYNEAEFLEPLRTAISRLVPKARMVVVLPS